MPKTPKAGNRKAAEALLVEGAARLLEGVSDPRTADLLDRLRTAAKVLRSEATADVAPQRQKRLIPDEPFPV